MYPVGRNTRRTSTIRDHRFLQSRKILRSVVSQTIPLRAVKHLQPQIMQLPRSRNKSPSRSHAESILFQNVRTKNSRTASWDRLLPSERVKILPLRLKHPRSVLVEAHSEELEVDTELVVSLDDQDRPFAQHDFQPA